MGTILILTVLLLAGTSLGAALVCVWLNSKCKRDRQQLREAVSAVEREVYRIASELRERDSAPSASSVVPNGFNLNRRAEAVRRLRAGVPLNNVANGTGWSAAEIGLLQKVEQLAEQERLNPNQIGLAGR